MGPATDQPQQQAGFSQKKQSERLYEAVEHAVKFYQVQLTKHVEALQYLREKRGYEKQTLLDFRFGYSSTNGTALRDYLLSKGFSADELKTTSATNVTYTIATYATKDTGHKFYYFDGGSAAAKTARTSKTSCQAPETFTIWSSQVV